MSLCARGNRTAFRADQPGERRRDEGGRATAVSSEERHRGYLIQDDRWRFEPHHDDEAA